MAPRRLLPPLLAALVVAVAGAHSSTAAPPAVRAQAPGPPPVLVAAGDIACPAYLPRTATRCHHAAVAALAARQRPAAVALLGDLQYNRGTLSEFRGSFARTWGRLARLRPAPGNHEYATPGAAGYYSYFGARAGPGRRGYYSFDVGDWHVVSLNSNCAVVACTPGSAQVRWLRADLAAQPQSLRAGLLAPPALLVGPARQSPGGGAAVERAAARGR